MKKLNDNEIANFVKLSEAENNKLGKGALRGVERYLDKDYWLSDCGDMLEFYWSFHDIIDDSSRFLLANYTADKPEILHFLHVNELEIAKQFAPVQTEGATYSHSVIVLKYLMSKVLLKILCGSGDLQENEKMVPVVLQALWRSYECDSYANPDKKEQWQAYDMLFKLIFKNYNSVIDDYEKIYKYDLAAHENSRRTLIKECYMLAKIANNDDDSDLLFGANTYISLLKYNYYLWRVNEDLDADLELIPLAIIVYAHQVIMNKSPGNPLTIFSSMQPKTVLEELKNMQSA